MSTRCTITVRDHLGQYTLYRHSDGYPDTEHGVLATLPEAFAFAWAWPRFEASDFAAAIVAAWKKEGGNIRLSSGHAEHADTEYHYEITAIGNRLNAWIKEALMVQAYEREDDGDTWKPLGAPHNIAPAFATKES